MSAVNSGRSFRHQFTMFDCACGTPLRVKAELAGTEVRCWSCRQMTTVPFPRRRAHPIGLLKRGVGEVWQVRRLGALMVVAALVTGALMVRRVGVPLATVALIAGAYGYGELIRRGDSEAEDQEGDELDRASYGLVAARGVAAVVFGLGLVAPVLLSPGGWGGRATRLTPLSLALAATVCVVLPLAMLALCGRSGERSLGWRGARDAIVAHPVELLAAFALIPLAAIVTEFATFAVTWLFEWTAFLVIDLYKKPQILFDEMGLRYVDSYFFEGIGDSLLFRVYRHLLRQGYTLTWGIPTTLSQPRAPLRGEWDFALGFDTYLAFRALITLMIVALMLFAFAVQACCLGWLAGVKSSPAALGRTGTAGGDLPLTGG